MKKICVITGTRADYGLLYWTLRRIQESPEFELQIIATGAHLSPEFGSTYKIIESDGFKISEKIDMHLSSDTSLGITKSMGLGLIGFAEAFQKLKPDLVLILGDRYESMIAAQAAMIAQIPIAHCHGGELTEGAIDEAIRHSITKMSHLHFTSTETYRKRVISLGENPKTVFNVGALGIENIESGIKLLDRQEFEKQTQFKFGKINFMVTYHPVTLSQKDPADLFKELLAGLDKFPQAHIIFTYPNADKNGRRIIDLIQNYVEKNKARAAAFVSLGQQKYLSAMQLVDVIIGNSSSGIIEAPSFKKPTVNIGDRQKGRLCAESILSCGDDSNAIVKAIEHALDPQFRQKISSLVSPYGSGDASTKILEILRKTEFSQLLMKIFYDSDESR